MRQAFEREPDNPKVRQAMSDVLAETANNWFNYGRYADARQLYAEALTLTPDRVQLLIWQANTELMLDHRAAAESLFEMVMSKATDLHDYVNVFRCWVDHNDLAAARSIVARAEAANFATAHFFVDLAGICFERGRPRLPVPFLMTAQRPKDDPWSQLGREMVQRAEAAATDPVGTLREIVSVLGQSEPDVALDYVKRLIKLLPDEPVAWTMQAFLQMLAGHDKAAKESARQAANLARKQNNPELLRDIETLRQAINNPLAGMLGGLFGGGLADDFDDDLDDDEEWF